jgi:eukaryotic-like serine/threonine-protein kinase
MKKIGQYEILQLLGEGGIGKVHAARDTVLGREVAIKSLRPELLSDNSFIDRFRAEATSLARLNHPNITTLYSLYPEGRNLYMIMECVRGQTLDAIVTERGGPLGATESLAIIAQACDGLAYAHSMGVIHRDIKPANLMVTQSGLLKVMDFGIARVQGSQRLTRDGSIVGTLAYMAPEQLRGQEGDERSDIYSLAIVLYEMLTGTPPFKAETDYDLMQAQINEKPKPLGARVRGLDARVGTALMKALSKKPEQRHASMKAFSEALGAAALRMNALQIVHDQTRVIEAPPTQPHRRSRLFVAIENSSPSWFVPVLEAIENGARSVARVLEPALKTIPLPPGIRGPVVGGVVAFVALAVFVSEVVLAPAPKVQESLRGQQAQVDQQSRGSAPSGNPAAGPAKVASAGGSQVLLESQPTGRDAAPRPGETAANTTRQLSELETAMGRKDYGKALGLARPLAEGGNRVAQMALGYMYEKGLGVPQNDEESVYWYKKSAEQGNMDAQYNLAFAYEQGRGIARSNFEAFRWYRAAAEQGLPVAQNVLGIMYAQGRGTTQNNGLAVGWFRRAAEQKFAKAQRNLGEMYASGRGVGQDDKEAMKWFREAASQKDSDASYNLGWWYENGRSVDQDYKIAADWYRKAEEQGNSQAQAALNRLRAGGHISN